MSHLGRKGPLDRLTSAGRVAITLEKDVRGLARSLMKCPLASQGSSSGPARPAQSPSSSQSPTGPSPSRSPRCPGAPGHGRVPPTPLHNSSQALHPRPDTISLLPKAASVPPLAMLGSFWNTHLKHPALLCPWKTPTLPSKPSLCVDSSLKPVALLNRDLLQNSRVSLMDTHQMPRLIPTCLSLLP